MDYDPFNNIRRDPVTGEVIRKFGIGPLVETPPLPVIDYSTGTIISQNQTRDFLAQNTFPSYNRGFMQLVPVCSFFQGGDPTFNFPPPIAGQPKNSCNTPGYLTKAERRCDLATCPDVADEVATPTIPSPFNCAFPDTFVNGDGDTVPFLNWAPWERATYLPGNFEQAMTRNCVNDFSYHMPGYQDDADLATAGSVHKNIGGNIGITQADFFDDRESDFMKQYYNIAVSMADHVRYNRGAINQGKVYVIGLGVADTTLFGTIPLNPYQDASNDFGRKDNFLARLALDPNARVPVEGLAGAQRVPLNTNFEADNIRRNPQADFNDTGEYLATSDADELGALFNRIARDILLKLIR